MKTFIRIALRIVQIMVGSIVLYCFIMLLLHNEPIKVFEFAKTKGEIIDIVEQKDDAYLVTYEYKVNEEFIRTKSSIWEKLLYENEKIVEFNIAYNKLFPSIHIINNFTLYGKYYIGLVWGLIMLTIFILIDVYADKEKWAERYRKFFKSL